MSAVVTNSLFLKRNPVRSVSTLGDLMAFDEEEAEELDARRPLTTDKALRTDSLTPMASKRRAASFGLMKQSSGSSTVGVLTELWVEYLPAPESADSMAVAAGRRDEAGARSRVSSSDEDAISCT